MNKYRTINRTHFLMILAILLLSGLCMNSTAQVIHWSNEGDTIIEPDVDIKVNKEYDENGNIIRYDSTYTSIYNYSGGNNIQDIDSIFNSGIFNFFGSDNFSDFDKGFFKDPFGDDFHEDFFNKRNGIEGFFGSSDDELKDFMNDFEQMMQQMDSIMHKMGSHNNQDYEHPSSPKKPVKKNSSSGTRTMI